MKRIALLMLAGCQTYDFEPVETLAIAQQERIVDIAAKPLKPNLFLVVDKSGSMRDPACTGCPSKMSELKSAMDTFLSGSGSVAHLGMMPFPEGDMCGPGNIATAEQLDEGDDDDTRLASQALLVKNKIDALQPGGGTPSGDTLKQLATYQPMLQKNRASYAVFLTDGAPNCNPSLDPNTCVCTAAGARPCQSGTNNQCLDDVGTANEIALLKDKGIKTIVIGFGSDVTGANLSTLAAAGGFSRPCMVNADCGAGDTCNAGGTDLCGRPARTCGQNFFRAGNATELGSVLDAIRASITCPPCFLPLKSRPSDPSFVSVSVNGDSLASGPDTWSYRDDPTSPAVEFVGHTCAMLMESTADKPVHVEVRSVEAL
jgi:hypothetical protein